MANQTNIMSSLIETLKLMRKLIGNESILNVVTQNLLSSILMCIRYSESVPVLLEINGFV